MENETPIGIDSLVLLGCLGMIILAVSIVLFVVVYQKKVLAQQNQIQATENKHQIELLNASIQVAELEREKIAKNIHDDVGTSLNVIKLQLTKISRNLDDKAAAGSLLKESMQMLSDSIENIRSIAKDLMPPTLIKLGLEKGIAELFRQINASGQMQIETAFSFSENRMPAKTELHVYRIIQEVISNIIKHSNAKHMQVSGKSDTMGMTISISHDGAGLTSETVSELTEKQQGIGLKSIQSRAQLIGASIQYLILGDGNAKILIEIPLHA